MQIDATLLVKQVLAIAQHACLTPDLQLHSLVAATFRACLCMVVELTPLLQMMQRLWELVSV